MATIFITQADVENLRTGVPRIAITQVDVEILRGVTLGETANNAILFGTIY